VSGRPGWCTTRSTHPEFLRLMADLVNTVNEGAIRYTLPFRHMTKGEMVGGLARAGLASLARMTVSCITHPLRRGGNRRQCGTCPACVFRRQSMWRAGIREAADAYVADVFDGQPGEREARYMIAFRQQATRLTELDGPEVPAFFRRHLYSSRIVSTEAEIVPYLKLFRRYRDEWAELEREVSLPNPSDYLLAPVGGGTSL
jgi:Queuosine biosynthesis protein QueC